MNKWLILVVISFLIILFFTLFSLISKKNGSYSNIFSKLIPEKTWYPDNFENYQEMKKFESKGEKIARECIQNILKKPFTNQRLPDLKNPNTNRNLEIDCFNSDLKIGIEYHGRNHYTFIPFFHKSFEEFKKSQERDFYKMEMCNKLGIFLIIVPYNLEHSKICDFIKSQLTKYKIIENFKGWNLDNK